MMGMLLLMIELQVGMYQLISLDSSSFVLNVYIWNM